MRALPCLVATALPVVVVLSILTIAGPAQAKSDVSLTLGAHRMPAGRPVRISATGGSDDAGGDSEVCIQVGVGPRWRDLRCSRPVGNDTGDTPTVRMSLAERRPVTVHLRARLYATDRHGGHRSAEQMTPEQIVRFAA